MIYLDTHVVVWLYAGFLDRFPDTARRLLAEEDLLISPMVVHELQYLYEIKRTTKPAQKVMTYLQSKLGLQICDKNFAAITKEALGYDWTRDPFNRIIVANASLENSPLLTKDNLIAANYKHTVWG